MKTKANEDWERLHAVIQYAGFTVNGFARHVGFTESQLLYRIKKGKNGISHFVAARILEHYPEIRRCWLLCGEGPMLRPKETFDKTQPPMIFHCNSTLPTV